MATVVHDFIAKKARFDAWVVKALAAAGYSRSWKEPCISFNTSLSKRDIFCAMKVAVACGRLHASRILSDLILAGSAAQIRLMHRVATTQKPVLDCILHHCPRAPVRAVLERLVFFTKLAEISPPSASSLDLNVTHFRSLGRIALKAAKTNWALFRFALSIAARDHLEGVLKNWSGLQRLLNLVIQEPELICAMSGMTAETMEPRIRLCELVLGGVRAHLKTEVETGRLSDAPGDQEMKVMCEFIADGRVNSRLLGRLVEKFGLLGIEYYGSAPNPNWLKNGDYYLKLLSAVPASSLPDVLELATTVSDLCDIKSFTEVFRELGAAAVPLIRAKRDGVRFGAAEMSAVHAARKISCEGTKLLQTVPVERWVSAIEQIPTLHEGVADSVALNDCLASSWQAMNGQSASQIIGRARVESGIVRLARLRRFDSRDSTQILDILEQNLTNFCNPPSDPQKHVVVIAAARTDHNDAFNDLYRSMYNLYEVCHPVLIEGDTPEELATRVAIIRANHMRCGRAQPISGFGLFGHGTWNSVEVSAAAALGLNSFEALRDIGEHLAPGSDFYLQACLVAYRSEGQDSFADFVGKAIPHCVVKGCATTRPSSPVLWTPEYGFDEVNRFHAMTRLRPYCFVDGK